MSEPDDYWRVHPVHTAYRVSRDGRVQSRWARVSLGRRGSYTIIGDEWREIKLARLPSGYAVFGLKIGDRGHRKSVSGYPHRMILEAFVGPCPTGQEVRHLNGRRDDNRLENLAWGTKKQNWEDMRRHGTYQLCSRQPGCRNQRLFAGTRAVLQEPAIHLETGTVWHTGRRGGRRLTNRTGRISRLGGDGPP